MFIGVNRSRYLFFPVYRCECRVPWLQKLTLPLISNSSPGKKIRRQMSSNLISKAGEHRRSELCGLDVTISARYDWPVACLFHYVIGISGILPYNRNVTLQTFFRSLEIFTACTVLTHGSIMLPPCQPRVFARLARWQ